MKKRWVGLLLMIPTLVMAQTSRDGVHFQDFKSLDQAKQKAKQENKFLFVDCYATWCLPCKKMESEVFSSSFVGKFVNANFISVRVQLDITNADNEQVKSWYKDAAKLKSVFNIKTLPTYLFIAPDGSIVHRSQNVLSDSTFLKVAMNALSSDKQYYTLLKKYRSNTLPPSRLRSLSIQVKQVGEQELAEKIAKAYYRQYLNKLSIDSLFDKKSFEFVRSFPNALSSKDLLFQVMYKQGEKVDDLMSQDGFSKNYVKAVITREELSKSLLSNGQKLSDPDWISLSSRIEAKYDIRHAEEIILDAQLNWYTQRNDWLQVIKYKIQKWDKYGLDTAGLGWVFINNFVFECVFKYCHDTDTLNKIANRMKQIIDVHPDDPGCVDTYANLLYKAGRQKEAIYWEELAVQLEEKDARINDRIPDKEFLITLNKIKSGVPTWIVN